MKLREFIFFGTVLLVVKTCDGFIDTVLDHVYGITENSFGVEMSDDSLRKQRGDLFITEMFRELSNLIHNELKEVKIPKFKQTMGSDWRLCTSETKVFLKLLGISTNTDFKFESYLANYIEASFNVDVKFKEPVTFKIYKDDNSPSLFCKDNSFVKDATYSFNGISQVKFSLIIPDFLKDRHNFLEKCIVYLNDVTIERLKEPIPLNNGEDISAIEIQNRFWSSVKERDISKMLRFGIKEAILKSNEGQSEHKWFCLSDYFLNSFKQNLKDLLVFEKGDLDKDINGNIIYQISYNSGIEPSFQLAITNSVLILQSQSNTDSKNYGTKCSESTREVNTELKTKKFTFITYYPHTFKCLREMFEIEKTFLDRFCQENLITLSNPGKSGAGLYLSPNKMFIAKTLKKRELTTLQKLFHKYVLNLEDKSSSLLPKFVGLYSYINAIGQYLVVMNNLMPDNKKIGQKYDLKGSLFNRFVSEEQKDKQEHPTFKDIDFTRHHPNGIYLKANDYEKLMKTIERDSSILEEYAIMDYSLLLGLHYVDYPKLTKKDLDSPTGEVTSFPCEKLDHKGSSSSSTNFKVNFQPTRIPAMTADGKKLMLYAGIIDILQEYKLKKKLETFALRHVIVRNNTFSAVEPDAYAKRFNEFMRNSVFKKMKACPKNLTLMSVKDP